MNMNGMMKVLADQCQHGLETMKGDKEAAAMTPTGFMTNSPQIAKALSRRCRGGHEHIVLLDRRAGPAAEYPEELCRAICMGLQEQMKADKALAKNICGLASDSILKDMGEAEEHDWDDAKGGWLDKEILMEARKKEMEYFRKMKVYDKVPRDQASQ